MKTVDNIKGLVKEGNTCLFFMFVLFNFFILLSSLGILGCATYLFVITKEANTFNVSFIVVGLLLLLLSLLSFKMRRSIHLMGFYLFILFFVFLFQLIITIVMIVDKDKLVEIAKKYMSDSDQSVEAIEKFESDMSDNIVNLSIALIIFCGVIVKMQFSHYLYRD